MSIGLRWISLAALIGACLAVPLSADDGAVWAEGASGIRPPARPVKTAPAARVDDDEFWGPAISGSTLSRSTPDAIGVGGHVDGVQGTLWPSASPDRASDAKEAQAVPDSDFPAAAEPNTPMPSAKPAAAKPVAGKAAAKPPRQPETTEVVCVAGCSGTTGQAVFVGAPPPPKQRPNTAPLVRVAYAEPPTTAPTASDVITCMAGCYQTPKSYQAQPKPAETRERRAALDADRPKASAPKTASASAVTIPQPTARATTARPAVRQSAHHPKAVDHGRQSAVTHKPAAAHPHARPGVAHSGYPKAGVATVASASLIAINRRRGQSTDWFTGRFDTTIRQGAIN